MTLPSYLLVLEQNKEQRLAITIDCVRNTHNKRMDSLFNFFVTEMNPNVDDIVELNKITYTKRDEHIRMDFQTWAFHSCVTTIDFMKQFPFVNLLRSTDQMILLKESYVKLGALISATRAYSSKKQCISFPDGTDCLPKTQWTVPKISPNLENRIRCRVIDKLRELNIQNDEFYLLSVLLFCNPGWLFIPFTRAICKIYFSNHKSFRKRATFVNFIPENVQFGSSLLLPSYLPKIGTI